MIARDLDALVGPVTGTIRATLDRSAQPRTDLTLFNSVRLHFVLSGVTLEVAASLVLGFQRRCPLYGTVAAAIADVLVTHEVSVA